LKDFVQEMKFDRMGCFAYSWGKHTYLLEDDVPNVKQDRANEIMELQSQISWDQEKLGRIFKCIIDRKEGGHFVVEQSLIVRCW
jgi:ribosomal protein S12 methylthiotransferase